MLLDDQHKYLSTPSLGVKLARMIFAPIEVPCPAILPRQCNAFTKAEGADTPQVLPPEPESAFPIITHRESRSHDRCIFISSPSLGVMLEAARTISPSLSSSNQGSSHDKSHLLKSNLSLKQEEAINVLNFSRSLLQDPSSDGLQFFISTPSLGIKLEAAKKTSSVCRPLSQDSLFDERHMSPLKSSVSAEPEAAQNMPVVAKSLAKNSSFGGLHRFISTPSLGVRLGIINRMPAFLETPSDLSLFPVEGVTRIDTEDEVQKFQTLEEQDGTGSMGEVLEPRKINICVTNNYVTEEVNVPIQEYKADSEKSTDNPKSDEHLPVLAVDVLVSTPHDAEDVVENIPSTASYQLFEFPLGNREEKSPACGQDEKSTAPGSAFSHGVVGDEGLNKPLWTKETASRRGRAWISRSQGMIVFFISCL